MACERRQEGRGLSPALFVVHSSGPSTAGSATWVRAALRVGLGCGARCLHVLLRLGPGLLWLALLLARRLLLRGLLLPTLLLLG